MQNFDFDIVGCKIPKSITSKHRTVKDSQGKCRRAQNKGICKLSILEYKIRKNMSRLALGLSFHHIAMDSDVPSVPHP
jgi:hypothetical protein